MSMIRAWIVVLAVLVAGCGPVSPTGNVISAPVDGQDVLINYNVIRDFYGDRAVRINVLGDVVGTELFVGSQQYTLSGHEGASDEWLLDKGTAIVYLEPGEYRVVAVSCSDGLFSVDCRRIGRSITIQ